MTLKELMTENIIVKNIRAYPVLRERFYTYAKGIRHFPVGFTPNKMFRDYLKVRRRNPEKRVSLSEYTIFGFYGLNKAQRDEFLTDVEATILMRPYNAESEPYLKDKVSFLHNFSKFVHRKWLNLKETDYKTFEKFVRKHKAVALKPEFSSWGIGFRKLSAAELEAIEDKESYFAELQEHDYIAEEFIVSHPALARFHPESLNTLRVITFRNGDRFQVFGCGLRVGNNGLHVDNAHGGGIFCEIDPETGIINTDGLDEHGNYYEFHPMTGVKFSGTQIPYWKDIIELCRKASQTLPCLKVVGWDIAILPGGKLELIEGNHNPGMNIVQAPAKRGVHKKFAALLLDFYGAPPENWKQTEEKTR